MELVKKAFRTLQSIPVTITTFKPVLSEENLALFTEPELKGLISAVKAFLYADAKFGVAYDKLNDVYEAMTDRLSKPGQDKEPQDGK
jgi:hypothetical protein